jgi:hypothetical protein
MRLTFLFKENRLVTDSLGFLLQKVIRAMDKKQSTWHSDRVLSHKGM